MVVACRAIKKAICFHRKGHDAYCKFSNNPYMIGFGILQVFLSQIPDFHKLTWLSTLAAATSFGYAFIGSGLSLATVIQGIITFTYIFPEDFNFYTIYFQRMPLTYSRFTPISFLEISPVYKSVLYINSLYNILSFE